MIRLGRNAIGLNLAIGLSLAVALSLAAGQAAHAQLFSDDEARRAILDLRAKTVTLEAQNQALVGRLDGMARGQLELFSQIERLRADLAILRGSIEQATQSSTLTRQQQKELLQQQKELFQSLEQQLQKADARLRQVEPQIFEIDGQKLSVSPDEKQAFEAIQAAVATKDFGAAVGQLVRFNQRHVGSSLAPWGLFLEGTMHYAQRNFQASILSLSSLRDRFPQHPKTADGLLTLAASQVEAGQTSNATRTLQDLIKRNPNSDQAKTAKARLATLKPAPAKK